MKKPSITNIRDRVSGVIFVCLIVLLANVATCAGATLFWNVTLSETSQGPSGPLNDELVIGTYNESVDNWDGNDVAEITAPMYYVSFTSLILEAPNYLSQDMKAPLLVGIMSEHKWDIRVRTDQFGALTLNFSWDPAYGYDFSGLEAQGRSIAELVLVDEGSTNGGYVGEYNLLEAGSFSIEKIEGISDTVRYMHIDALVVIPEPSVLVLVGLGLGAALAKRRKS